MPFSQADEIRGKLNIVDIIQEYVPLKKAGANFKAPCPFHKETVPSFMVSLDKQIWHCFGCGKGGSIFDFIMEIENVEFPEALRILANKAGVILRRENPKVRNEKVRILEANEEAARYFNYILEKTDIGKKAFSYLRERGVSDEIISDFQLGFAPSWHTTEEFLLKKGFSCEEILKAGLTVKNEKGKVYDRFRSRIMFPVKDTHGNVIGFGGRILDKNEEGAKYINTPETPAYHKSRVLFNLNNAKKEIKEKEKVVLVEGYMDVIASYKAGVKNVVASSGTALAREQIFLIKRYTPNLLMAFDADSAGKEATKRSIKETLSAGLNTEIIELPSGEDPGSLAVKDPEKWQELVARPEPVIDFYFKKAIEGIDLKSIEGKKKIAEEILPVLKSIANIVVQGVYMGKLAKEIDIDEKYLWEELKKTDSFLKESPQEEKILLKEKPKIEALREGRFLGLILKYSEYLKEKIDILSPDDFETIDFRVIYEKLQKFFHNTPKVFDKDSFISSLTKELGKETEILILGIEQEIDEMSDESEVKTSDIEKEINITVKTIKKESLKKKITKLIKEIQETPVFKNEEKQKKLVNINELIKEFKKFD